jgi:hypothetical protein
MAEFFACIKRKWDAPLTELASTPCPESSGHHGATELRWFYPAHTLIWAFSPDGWIAIAAE